MSDAAESRSRWWSVGALAILTLLAALLHLRAGYTFPRPWPDEAHFITPALTLLREGRLAVPELNAPGGIFWMPTGYYVAQLPLLVLRIDPLVAGRLLSLIGVVVFTWGVFLAATRAGVHAAVAFGALLVWLCMPRVVAIGNIARMEGVILGIVGLCLWLTSSGRWPLAVSVSLLAPLVHPVGVVVPVAVAVAALVDQRGRRWTHGEWIVLAVAVGVWVAQVAYLLAHAGVAADHLRFQFTRKAGRPITLQWWQWALLAITAVSGAVATWRWRRSGRALAAVETMLALAGAFVLVDVVGREMWYEHLGRETAVLLAGLVAIAALSRVPTAAQRWSSLSAAFAVVLVLVAGLAVRGTLAGGWYGMRAVAGSTAEWHAFTQRAMTELRRIDEAAPPATVVVVDPLSGFGHEVVGHPWRNLRFVQPTPATPMNTTSADYVLATPGVPFTTEALVTQWGTQSPTVELRSDQGTFGLQLYANPDG